MKQSRPSPTEGPRKGGEAEKDMTPMQRFTLLTRRLLNVSNAELRKEQRAIASRHDAKAKRLVMVERKKKIQIVPGGPFVDGMEVSVDESNEKWSEYKLADGTVIRLKQVLMEIVRAEGQYDNEGNPTYVVKATPMLSLVEVPDRLKRKTN